MLSFGRAAGQPGDLREEVVSPGGPGFSAPGKETRAMDPSGLLRLRSPRLGFLDLGRLLLLLLLPPLWPLCGAFNLDADSPAEYSGPEGSYFGFAVDFFVPSASS